MADLYSWLKLVVDSIPADGADFHADPAFHIERFGDLFLGNSEHWCKFETSTVPLSVSNRGADTALAVEEADEPRIEIVVSGWIG